MRSASALVLSLGLLLGVPGNAIAQAVAETESPTLPSDADVAPEEVNIFVVGSMDQLERLRGAVAVWRLGDRVLSWQLSPAFEPRSLFEAGTDHRISCWIDLSQGRTVHLYFANGRTQRFLVRSLGTSGELDEMDREALGQAVELSLLALLEDRAAGMSREDTESLLSVPAPEAEPEVRPVPETPSRAHDFFRWEIGLRYAVLPLLDRPPLVHGPGVEFAHAVVAEPRMTVFLGASYRFGETWRSDLSDLGLQSTALRLGTELGPKLAEWGRPGETSSERVALRLAVGVDLVELTPGAGRDATDATLTEARQRIEPALAMGVESLTTFASGLSLRVGLALDLPTHDVSYEVEIDGQRQSVFRALRLRPAAVLGVGIALH